MMNGDDAEVRTRIATLVETIKHDRARSHQLFQYVWAMICVRRGLMRVVQEMDGAGSPQLLLEEVRTGRQRLVIRPQELDNEIEGLAVQALSRILGETRP